MLKGASVNQESLRECLDYCSETGKFRWRERPESHFSSSAYQRAWNTRYSGKVIRSLDSKGYMRISLFDKHYLAHRLAWLYIHGRWPDSQIDHINHIKTDNRIANLREVSQKENSKNRPIYKINTSGVPGVRWRIRQGKWEARIRINGKDRHLGCFDEFLYAVAARKSSENKYGFHQNHGGRNGVL